MILEIDITTPLVLQWVAFGIAATFTACYKVTWLCYLTHHKPLKAMFLTLMQYLSFLLPHHKIIISTEDHIQMVTLAQSEHCFFLPQNEFYCHLDVWICCRFVLNDSINQSDLLDMCLMHQNQNTKWKTCFYFEMQQKSKFLFLHLAFRWPTFPQ